MPLISIYSTDAGIRGQLAEQLSALEREETDPLRTEEFASFSGFLDSGRRNPCRILLLAQTGTDSVELVATTVEECPANPVVWLSDLDFGLFSYRLEVAHFGLLPGTKETLRTALHNCRRKSRRLAARHPQQMENKC